MRKYFKILMVAWSPLIILAVLWLGLWAIRNNQAEDHIERGRQRVQECRENFVQEEVGLYVHRDVYCGEPGRKVKGSLWLPEFQGYIPPEYR